VTYMIEGLRVLVITGWDGQALALGFGISVAVAVCALFAAAAALPGRMART
jgi:ABC-2 type transport system permease protein